MSNKLRHQILSTGAFEIGRANYASEDTGNNKLDLDKVATHPLLRRRVGGLVADIVEHYGVQVLLAIPSGGNWVAEEAADVLEHTVRVAYLEKIPSTIPGVKKFDYKTEEDRDLVLSADSLALTEDLFRKFTSTCGALAVDGVVERAEIAVAVWDRGIELDRTEPDVPHRALINEFIPDFVDEADDIYAYARHLLHAHSS